MREWVGRDGLSGVGHGEDGDVGERGGMQGWRREGAVTGASDIEHLMQVGWWKNRGGVVGLWG